MRNFTYVFDDRTSFRAKGLPRTLENRNFTSVFDDRTSFRAKGLQNRTLKIAILLQFLTIQHHFVRKGCAGRFKIAISLQFLTIEPRFVQKGCVSWPLVGTAPRIKREIEKKETEKGKRARERRCEDKKM